jgi:hypothetical protein
VPYGYPSRGSAEDRQWASIHSSPPWEDLDVPTVVHHEFGQGRAVYSAADIERVEADANAGMFLGIVRSLARGPWTYEADAHPAVWMTVFDQPDQWRQLVTLLHCPADLPPLPVTARIRLRPPAGRSFRDAVAVAGGQTLDPHVRPDGVLEADVVVEQGLAMVLATY